jgi:DNA-binding CsgD family transcriptional regulator
MNLGVKTIGTYRDRVKQKLGIKTAAELIRRAVLWTEQEFFNSSGPDDVS